MKKLLILLCLVAANSLFSQTAIFTGNSSNDWDTPSNWSTGLVPGNNDFAEISAGLLAVVPATKKFTVKGLVVYGGLELSSGAHLAVQTTASVVAVLNVNTGGYVNNFGHLNVISSSQAIYNIYSTGTITNYQSGLIVSKGGNVGVNCQTYSNFENFGQLLVRNCTQALNMEGCTVINRATGIFTMDNFITQTVISNYGTLTNEGTMNLASTNVSYAALLNGGSCTNSAQGSINCFRGRLGIQQNTMINYGTISLQGPSLLLLTLEGGLKNYGEITIQNSFCKIEQDASILNYSSGVFSILGSITYGLFIEEGAFYNKGGMLEIEAATAITMDDPDAQIDNYNCGTIQITEGNLNILNGEFENNSHLILDDPAATHVISGSLVNKGVISDPYLSLQGLSISNLSVIADPLSPPVIVGQASAAALNLGALSYVSQISWRRSINGSSAGSYSTSNNTFTPNSGSAGLDFLYVRMKIGTCPYIWPEIEAPGGIQAPPAPYSGNNTGVFPNPAIGDIHVSLDQEIGVDGNWALYDASGKLILTNKFSELYDRMLHIARPAGLAAGSYVLVVSPVDGEAVSFKVGWQ